MTHLMTMLRFEYIFQKSILSQLSIELVLKHPNFSNHIIIFWLSCSMTVGRMIAIDGEDIFCIFPFGNVWNQQLLSNSHGSLFNILRSVFH